jgi:hypothetical protein
VPVASKDGERPAELRRITKEHTDKHGNTTFANLAVMAVFKEEVNEYDVFRATDKTGQDWLEN